MTLRTDPDTRGTPKNDTVRKSLQGCPVHDLRAKLREAGLRPTRQRVALGWLLFSKGNRHVSAEALYDEATESRVPLSLATVYNTLRQFTEAGILRQVTVDASRAYFDTNTSEHHHFLVEDTGSILDIPSGQVAIQRLPTIPDGMEIVSVDVIVRLKTKSTHVV